MIKPIFLDIWVWIIPIVIFIAIVIVVIGIIRMIQDDLSFWIGGIIFGGIALLICIPTYFAFILVPYDSSFYYTYKITGEVSEVNTAFENGNGVVSPSYVIKVKGVDYLIKSNDVRVRLMHTGDSANLVCTKSFAYFQEPWYDCSIGGN